MITVLRFDPHMHKEDKKLKLITWAAMGGLRMKWHDGRGKEELEGTFYFAPLCHDCNSCTVTSLLIVIYATLIISVFIQTS